MKLSHKQISKRGGINFWKGKTPEEKSLIWKERSKKAWATKRLMNKTGFV